MEVDLLKYEKELYKKGYKYIAGTDEAGRGPLAGPVVVAAVILPVNFYVKEINDSKKISEKKRNMLFDIIIKEAIAYTIEVIDSKTIDEINIYAASKLGMHNAINNLNIKPDYILSDAMPLDFENSMAIIKGDSKSITIAAASILAKVTRDRYMEDLDKKYPLYEFCKHKGYPTKKHIENMNKYGIISEYRMTFKPVKDVLNRSK